MKTQHRSEKNTLNETIQNNSISQPTIKWRRSTQKYCLYTWSLRFYWISFKKKAEVYHISLSLNNDSFHF